MARVILEGDYIVISPTGLWKVFGFCWRKRISLAQVTGASWSVRPETAHPVTARRPGTAAVSGLAGYMHGPDGRSWWLFRYGSAALVLELRGGPLAFVVLDVDDPSGMAIRIAASVRDHVASDEVADGPSDRES